MYLFILVISLIISYLLGSIPFGYVIGKRFKGVDVRDYGSGKTGATNVLRTAGVSAGLLSFVFDMAKGAGAVVFTGWLFSLPGQSLSNPYDMFVKELSRPAAGMAAIIGHDWPIFLKFRGGRGVMPTAGAFIVLSPIAVGGAALVGLMTIAIFRFVSLGSILGVSSLTLIVIYLYYFKGLSLEILLFSIISSLLVILQHNDNISRLVNGTERKLGQKAENI